MIKIKSDGVVDNTSILQLSSVFLFSFSDWSMSFLNDNPVPQLLEKPVPSLTSTLLKPPWKVQYLHNYQV
jgi:hypothetical protein